MRPRVAGRRMPTRGSNHGGGLAAIAIFSAAMVACGQDGDDSGSPPDTSPSPDQLVLRFEPVPLMGGAPEAITEMKFVPGTREFLLLSKSRTVTHYRLDDDGAGAVRLGAFDVPGVDQTADCGLLSLAFDPDFATNRLVYFALCESTTYSQIAGYELDLADYSSIASSGSTIIRIGHDRGTEGWHNVGSIGFDPEGYLWALFGDKNVPGTSQDLSSNLGSVIRIAPYHLEGGYEAAPLNPFAGMPGRSPDIAAFGLRSPWRGMMDEAGRLWIGDVGNSTHEEVNISRFAGENFGNSVAEGPCTTSCDGLTDPIVSWDRDNGGLYAREDPQSIPTARRVVWVGLEYPRAPEIDRYEGKFSGRVVVGDFCTGWIRAIELDDEDQVVYNEAAGHLEAATSWVLGPDGFVYVSAYGSSLAWPYEQGAIYRALLAGE